MLIFAEGRKSKCQISVNGRRACLTTVQKWFSQKSGLSALEIIHYIFM